MNRKAFHILLKKYLDGSCSEEERRLVDQWYEVLEDDAPVALTDTELDEIEDHLWNRICGQNSNTGLPINAKPVRRPVFRLWIKWGAAAATLAAIVTGIYIFAFYDQFQPSIINNKVKEGLHEEVNATSVTREIILEDGSKVCLGGHSKIAFPAHFPKNKREVYLEGEAFFNVSKNPGRPFFVYNKNLVAEVLGTSFNIKIINNKIEVAVKTGRVAVFENGQRINLNAHQKIENGVIITPNQKVTYHSENRHFITSLVDSPLPIIADSSGSADKITKFVFDDSPISEVMKAIEKAYGIEIILENETLGNCPFTGDITNQNLFNKLELVCQAFQAAYEIKGTMILIKGGKGCN